MSLLLFSINWNKQLFSWTHWKLTNLNVLLIPEKQYKGKKSCLREFSAANPISGTKKLQTMFST